MSEDDDLRVYHVSLSFGTEYGLKRLFLKSNVK